MLTDSEFLLLLLWGIYLWECLVWHDRYGLVFRSWWGGHWHQAGADYGFGGPGKAGWEVAGHGCVWANPLAWGGQTVMGHLLPLAISPERIVAGNLQTAYATGRLRQSHRAFPLKELTDISVREEELWLNGGCFCRFSSAILARKVLALLRNLRNCLPEQREELIRGFWRDRFDRTAFRKVWEPCQVAAKRLQWGCVGLFLLMYVAAPVLTVLLGTSLTILFAGPLALLTAFCIEWGAFRARRRLGIGTFADAVGEWVKGTLCPPVAIRAADCMTRQVAPLFDPLTLAVELLPADSARSPNVGDFFARVSADLHHPLAVDEEWGASDRETMAWQDSLVLDEALRAFPGQGEVLSEHVPQRLEPAMRGYCPRCGSQYASEIETCPDCPGVRLYRWNTKDMATQKMAGKNRPRRRQKGRRK